MHVGDAVAADKVDVHVENVCAFALLRFGQAHEPVPILDFQQIAHLL